MAHQVRVEVPLADHDAVEKAVWEALQGCPDDDNWQVAIVQDPLKPETWEAVAKGPLVDTDGAWERLAAEGRWMRSPEAFYRRTFDGRDEQDLGFLCDCLRQLFRCFDRPRP